MEHNLAKNRLFGFSSIICILLGCSGSDKGSELSTAATAGTIIELPDTVLGKFTGTAMIGEQTSQFANAIVAKSGLMVTISFSGGKPTLSGNILKLSNLKFAAGERSATFDSISTDGSLSGIHLSEYKTNLNIGVKSGGINFVFTGVKCNTMPENLVCTCETNPKSSMCQ